MILLALLLATVTAPYAPPTYACNGSQAIFTVNFPYLASADVVLTSTTAGGAATTLTQGTDYALSVSSTSRPATATLTVPGTTCPTGNQLKISRVMQTTQPYSFRAQTTFNPALHELAFDRQAMETQGLSTNTATLGVTGLLSAADWARFNSTVFTAINQFQSSGVGAVTLALATKVGQFSHVRDFGALCDGSTNDSAAMQKAVSAAASTPRSVWVDSNCVGTYTNTSGVRVFDLRVINVNGANAFTGFAGIRTAGAPRWFLGSASDIGDDAAIVVARALLGDSLFSHAYEDQSTMTFTTTGAYASYDSVPTMNGSIHYNHFYSFQARPQYNGSGLIDDVTGFLSHVSMLAGTATHTYGMHINDVSGAGPVVGDKYGVFVDTMAGSGFAFFAQGNPSFLGGNLQIAGALNGATTGSFSGEVIAGDFNSTGSIAAFNSGGGLAIAGSSGTTPSVIKAYSNGSGTEKELDLQPGGNLVLVGGPVQLNGSGSGNSFANLGASANGTMIYCSNCTIANPCASGGTGAIAKRLNSVWVCN